MNTKKINKLWVLLPVLLAFETACRKKNTQAAGAYEINIITETTGYLSAGDISNGFKIEIKSNRGVEETYILEIKIDGELILEQEGKDKLSSKKIVMDLKSNLTQKLNNFDDRTSRPRGFKGKDVVFTIKSGKTQDKKIVHAQYDVRTCKDLQALDLDLTGEYKQIQDIDCKNASFNPIGRSSGFAGIYDGRSKKENRNLTISNLEIRETEYAGIFSKISPKGVVANIIVKNVEMLAGGTGKNIGVIAGENNGYIVNVGVETFELNGKQFIGGIAGSNNKGGEIVSAYIRNPTIFGARNMEDLGGICGQNEGIINGVYANTLDQIEKTPAGRTANKGQLAGSSKGRILNSMYRASGNGLADFYENISATTPCQNCTSTLGDRTAELPKPIDNNSLSTANVISDYLEDFSGKVILPTSSSEKLWWE
jgi:hypothetical protein